MSLQETLDALKEIEQIATLAGLKGAINDDQARFEMGFNLDQGRAQMVYVRFAGKGPEDVPVVTFYSPARVISKGFLKGMSKDDAVGLLRANSNLFFARFGILESEKEVLIMASVDHILGTLDADEFLMSARCVAMAADTYERQFGGDDF